MVTHGGEKRYMYTIGSFSFFLLKSEFLSIYSKLGVRPQAVAGVVTDPTHDPSCPRQCDLKERLSLDRTCTSYRT